MTNSNLFNLNGKVALVTGAAQGLGEATTRALTKAGAKVMITDIQTEKGDKLVSDIKAAGGDASFFYLDVTNENQWKEAVQKTVDHFGGLDVLVNNAGIEILSFVEQMSLEDFRKTHAINVDGTFLGIKSAISVMKPGGISGRGGSIINLSSVAGFIGFPALSAYCSSKGAVRSMTKAVALECAKMQYNIRVNSVHPGVIRTEMGVNLLNEHIEAGIFSNMEEALAVFNALHPAGEGSPNDIANAILYLASDASKWVTGSELKIDGGLTAQ
ncbi:glucose 1-dehydrogenase [Gottfriedia sp. NPDC057948]|uniref:glucose 1-dehydrogenase n=1 Tax=Gottfriedia sp. NPDC057948 TaxID=3346287 RepID=UPI0036DF9A0F